jgi:hypothetical protein
MPNAGVLPQRAVEMSWSIGFGFWRPSPKLTSLAMSLAITGTRSRMSSYLRFNRAAMLPQPMSKPTPEIDTCSS